MKIGSFEFNLRELSGSMGDFGTLLPLAVGYVTVCGMDPCGLLVWMGLANIVTGLVYRLPMPIEPMKALAIMAIAQAWSPDKVLASGLAMLHPAFKVVDLIGAIVVGVFILWAAWKIARPAIDALVDGSAGRETRKKIYSTANYVAGVRDVHALRTRFLGQGVDVCMHVMVDANITVEEGHEIAHKVEDALRALGPEISHVTIHIEPWYG